MGSCVRLLRLRNTADCVAQTTGIYVLVVLESEVQDEGAGRLVSLVASLLGLHMAALLLPPHRVVPVLPQPLVPLCVSWSPLERSLVRLA